MATRFLSALILTGLSLLCVNCTGARKPNPDILSVVQSIDEAELKGYCTALAEIGSRPAKNRPKTEWTVRFLEKALKEAGYDVIVKESVGSANDSMQVNIVAEIMGVHCPEKVVELGVHYDTVSFSPGADDNGSGVAGVLAVARALSKTRCAKTIRFVFYCMEEIGGMGSLTHVQRILENPEEQVEGALVFEMIGYAVEEPNSQRTPIRIPLVVWPPRTGNSIVVVGNGKSAFLGNRYEQCADIYEPALKYYSLNRLGGFLKDAARSDHVSYWRSDLPAIMLTDTAEFRNPNYHKPSDRIETLNLAFMTQVTRVAAATLLEWAEMPPATADGQSATGTAGRGNRRGYYHEYCRLPFRLTAIENPDIGMPVGGLSREEACREIIERYWDAAIRGEDEQMARLWCGWPSGGHPRYREEKRPEKLVHIGAPYCQEGCNFGTVTLVTPSLIQYTDGTLADMKLIVIFRDLGLDTTCLIVGTWGGEQVLEKSAPAAEENAKAEYR